MIEFKMNDGTREWGMGPDAEFKETKRKRRDKIWVAEV